MQLRAKNRGLLFAAAAVGCLATGTGLAIASAGRQEPHASTWAAADDPWTSSSWALDRLAEDPRTRAETVEFETRLAAARAGLRVDLVPPGDGVQGAAAATGLLLQLLRTHKLAAGPANPLRRRKPLYSAASPFRQSIQRWDTGPSQPDVDAAIATASSISGVSPAYLWRTAYAESRLRGTAVSATSSASGLFQFVSGTWLDALRRFGPGLGLGNAASMIRVDGQGRPRVDDPAARVAILALRNDNRVAAAVAAMVTSENAARLSQRFGSPPPAEILYLAHVLGSSGAADLVRAVNVAPDLPAASLFPAAAAANRGLFYRRGIALSAIEVAQRIAARARS